MIPEKEALHIVYQLLQSLNYLHKKGIIHRDVKLENVLISDQNVFKICDFGWCSSSEEDNRNVVCGTYEYMAPEVVLEREYDDKIDVWSAGILAYELTHGKTPFHSNELKDIIGNILKGDFIIGSHISREMGMFLCTCLEYFPERRPSADSLLNHPIFKEIKKSYYRRPENASIDNERSFFWNRFGSRHSRFEMVEDPSQNNNEAIQFLEYNPVPWKNPSDDSLPEELSDLNNYEIKKFEMDLSEKGEFTFKNMTDFIDFDIDFSGPINFFKGAGTSFMSLFQKKEEEDQAQVPQQNNQVERLEIVKEESASQMDEEEEEGNYTKRPTCYEVPDEDVSVGKLFKTGAYSVRRRQGSIETNTNTEVSSDDKPQVREVQPSKGVFDTFIGLFSFD